MIIKAMMAISQIALCQKMIKNRSRLWNWSFQKQKSLLAWEQSVKIVEFTESALGLDVQCMHACDIWFSISTPKVRPVYYLTEKSLIVKHWAYSADVQPLCSNPFHIMIAPCSYQTLTMRNLRRLTPICWSIIISLIKLHLYFFHRVFSLIYITTKTMPTRQLRKG